MRDRLFVGCLVAGLAAAGCASDDAAQPAEPGGDGRADLFDKGPLLVTGAFDGSKRFGMWVDTVDFTRQVERDTGKPVHFTYFINTCYYDNTTRGSAIGRSHSREEDIVRFALTQQAINEGHEVASHAVLHKDGSDWSADRWREEFQSWDDVVRPNLFEPVLGDDGEPVFPRWVATASGGETGAACQSDSECNSGNCLPVSPSQGFCTQPCNGNRPCPNDTHCGAPDWNTSTDVCVPMPEFPVVHNGEEMFAADGTPNLEHPDLQSYRVIGFRAPQLGHNKALYQVMEEFGFVYDTSHAITGSKSQRAKRSFIDAPFRIKFGGKSFPSLYQFGLMSTKGASTIPMDFNYKANNVGGEKMLSDYKNSILDAYNNKGRVPWNIGHHFALWRGGAYWQAMKDAFTWAARGCPDGSGAPQCEDTEFPSFKELVVRLDGLGGSSDNSDAVDPFDVDVEGASGDIQAHPDHWDDEDAH